MRPPNFKPNLLGKICFVAICSLEYIFVVRPIVRFLRTNYLLIDLLLFTVVLIVCGAITAELIVKFLQWLVRKYEKQ